MACGEGDARAKECTAALFEVGCFIQAHSRTLMYFFTKPSFTSAVQYPRGDASWISVMRYSCR